MNGSPRCIRRNATAVCPAGREVAQRVLEAGEAHSTILLDWRDEDDV